MQKCGVSPEFDVLSCEQKPESLPAPTTSNLLYGETENAWVCYDNSTIGR